MNNRSHRGLTGFIEARTCAYCLLVISASLFFVMPSHSSTLEKDCKAIQQELERKKQRMSEYISALQKFNEQDDVEIVGAMNQKISELSTQMRKLEKDLAGCDKRKSQDAAQGFSIVKSDDGRYATVPCGELRKKLVVLMQKAHGLKKRQQSMLSELTATETRELQEVSQDLQAVRDALKTRCAQPPAPKPFRREPRSAGRN